MSTTTITACVLLLVVTLVAGAEDPHHFLASGKYDRTHWMNNPGCGDMERIRVRRQWIQAYLGEGRTAGWDFATAIWRTLDVRMPDFPAFWDRIHNGSLESKNAQYGRLIGYFNLAYNMLDVPDMIDSHYHYLRTRHLTVRFCPLDTPVSEIFMGLRDSILEVVPAFLGCPRAQSNCFDRRAWVACTTAIFEGFGGKLASGPQYN